jgi:dihydrodipicolinate synthase/N-acetylneuraminate lyase
MNSSNQEPSFITATGTPLTEDDRLHVEGLEAHLEDQHRAGIHSLLMAGTMGMMPLLPDQTWRDLVTRSVELGRGRFELLIGATEPGLARTLERIEFLNGVKGIDGVVAMTPSFLKFSQAEYIDYYRALADAARVPVYLYDLQPMTGVHLSVETISALAKHPNIAGVKMSANLSEARRVARAVEGEAFRVIVAEPDLIDLCTAGGIQEQLDGMYAAAPDWTVRIGRSVVAGQFAEAARLQGLLTELKYAMVATGSIMAAFSAVMHARGIPGRFVPQPARMLDETQRRALLASPPVRALLAEAR